MLAGVPRPHIWGQGADLQDIIMCRIRLRGTQEITQVVSEPFGENFFQTKSDMKAQQKL